MAFSIVSFKEEQSFVEENRVAVKYVSVIPAVYKLKP